MRHLGKAAALAAAFGTSAIAGGVDRSEQPIGIIFEPGNYIEFTYRTVNPDISGTQVAVLPPTVTGSDSGSQARGFGYTGLALKFGITDNFDLSLIYDQPYGASIDYPLGTGFYASGASANLSADAFSAIGRYRFGGGFSAYAGLRHQTFSANAVVPFASGYSGDTGADGSFGYLLGAAYERPDIALRVALTYFSKISHDLTAVENSLALGAGRISGLTVETPQAVNLDLQTGIAPGTLLFGGVRWANWSDFDITPDDYRTLTGGSLVSYADDTFTYTLGIGRQLTENWAIAVTATHEPSNGGFRSNLNPTDGRNAVGLGVTYTQDEFKLQAGLQHIWIGDGTTTLDGVTPAGEFEDNTALAFGLKAGFSF